MFDRFFGNNQTPETPVDPLLQQSGNFDFKTALGLIGSGLLAKGLNRNADITPILAQIPEIQKQNQQKALLSRMATDFSASPVLKDPQTAAMVRDLVAAGMPDKALEIIKNATPKAPEAYTLNKDAIRYDANNKPVAFGKTIGSEDELKTRRLNISSWANMPVNQRQAMIAQASGMGIDPNEANRAFEEGKTIPILAKEKNLDPNNLPTPIYPTTVGSLSRIQARQQALTEMDSLGKTISEWTAPYARRWKGYSIPAIIDAAKGENTEQVAKYLAARGAALDQAAIRVKTLGGNVGENILNDMVNSAMGKIEFPSTLVGSDLYAKTQAYLDKAIRESVMRANKVGLTPALANEDSAAFANNADFGGEMVTIRNNKTGETKTITRTEAQKMGAI